jgi:hypothetical protein
MALFTKPVFGQQKQQYRQKKGAKRNTQNAILTYSPRDIVIYLFEYFCYTSRIFGMFGFGFDLEMVAAAMYL